MRVKRWDIEDWVKKLEDRGINEFEFKNLPDDLKFKGGLQKAKGIGLLEIVKTTKGRHTWRVVPTNIWKNIYNNTNKKE